MQPARLAKAQLGAVRADPRRVPLVLVVDDYADSRDLYALTGHEVTNHGKAVYDAGCDEYLTKPVSPDALAAAVRTALTCRDEPGTGTRSRLP